jgi:hypothetical protein
MAELTAAEQRSPAPAKIPETYSSADNEWPEWSAIVRNFLRRHGGDVPGLLRLAEGQEEKVTLAEMDTEVARKAGLIMGDLTSLTRAEALRLVISLEGIPEADNGLEAWRLLARRARGSGTETLGHVDYHHEL